MYITISPAMHFPPLKKKKRKNKGQEECYLTGDPCIAWGTFAVLHLSGQGQVYDVRASCVQGDGIQPTH